MSIRVGVKPMGRTSAFGMPALPVKFTETWGELYSEPPAMTSIFSEGWGSTYSEPPSMSSIKVEAWSS